MPWSHIILEGYCMYKNFSKKTFITYTLKDTEVMKFEKGSVLKNENYIPKTQRPKWCSNKNKNLIPQFKCLCNSKKATSCPFFAYTDANKKDYKMFFNKYKERIKEGVKK